MNRSLPRRASSFRDAVIQPLERRQMFSAGDADFGFGAAGQANLAFAGAQFDARAIAIRADGKTIVAGTKGGRLAVVRLNVDGSIDSSFGGGGLFESTVMTRANDVAIQSDGKIVVVGLEPRVGGGPDPNRFTTARILSNGEGLDTTFDGDGVVSRLYGDSGGLGGYCYANAVAIQNDGKIVVGGMAFIDSIIDFSRDFAITRYNSDGSPDNTFGMRPAGVPLGWNHAAMGGEDEILDLALDYNGTAATNPHYGKIVAVGNTDAYWQSGWIPQGSQFAVARFQTNGQLDGGLDGDGKLTTSFSGAQTAFATGVIIQPGGKIVATGSMGPNSGDRNLALARFNSNGSLDTSFAGGGKVQQDLYSDDVAYGVARSFAGGFLVASSTGVAAFSADGVLDTRFSQDGAVSANARAGVATTGSTISPVRKLVIAGSNIVHRLVDVGPRGALLAGITETHEANGPTLNIIVGTDRMPTTQRIYIDVGGTAVAPVFSLPANWDYSTTNITTPGFNVPRWYVDIPAGQTFTTFTITPINDTRAEGDETIEVSVSPDPTYDLGNPNRYTLLIRDDDVVGGPTVAESKFHYETAPQQLTFRFSQNVQTSIADADFQLTGPPGIPSHTFAYNGSVNTGTLMFASPLPDGNYTARAVAAGITNAQGQPMPADHVLNFFFLAGDANHDRIIDIGDFAILAGRFNLPGTFSQGDFNYSGQVEIGDFAIVASKFNTSVPAPSAAYGDGLTLAARPAPVAMPPIRRDSSVKVSSPFLKTMLESGVDLLH